MTITSPNDASKYRDIRDDHDGHELRDTRTVIRADGNYFGTVRRRFVASGLHMSETAYATGARIPTHRHECPSFFMPLGGTFVEGCGNVVRRYQTGDVGYHPPYEPHWLHTHGSATHGFAVEVGAGWCGTVDDTTGWDATPRDLSHSRVSWLMGRLYIEFRTQDTARSLTVEALGVEISLELSRERLCHERREPAWLVRIRERLHEPSLDTPSLTALAALAQVTPAGMIKAFRRHTGGTPGEYLRAIRLARARTALGGTDRPLGAIALDAGFYDHSHFTRTFHRAMGVAPLVYRRLLRS